MVCALQEGDPYTTSLMWLKNGEPISATVERDTSKTKIIEVQRDVSLLIIDGADSGDNGNYTCVAQSDIEGLSDSVTASLIVRGNFLPPTKMMMMIREKKINLVLHTISHSLMHLLTTIFCGNVHALSTFRHCNYPFTHDVVLAHLYSHYLSTVRSHAHYCDNDDVPASFQWKPRVCIIQGFLSSAALYSKGEMNDQRIVDVHNILSSVKTATAGAEYVAAVMGKLIA